MLQAHGPRNPFTNSLPPTHGGCPLKGLGEIPIRLEVESAEYEFAKSHGFGAIANAVGIFPPGPVRRFLPDLMNLVLTRKFNPGRVFDLSLALGQRSNLLFNQPERQTTVLVSKNG
jgi:hypothetical protein